MTKLATPEELTELSRLLEDADREWFNRDDNKTKTALTSVPAVRWLNAATPAKLRPVLETAKAYHRLTSALAFIDSKTLVEQVNAVASLGPDHRSWTMKGTFRVAKKLGWKDPTA